ncbi:unnamed protein product [Cylindrotheca closterium]|uniref:HSF-type DNA-binding domain-containing protein n=1 Tax=Cylindrotheca closterium TaxID=2856 RepID=A0AAD2G655_9STRA|nr:unnamed protein product [Cylindrotheca closterium]
MPNLPITSDCSLKTEQDAALCASSSVSNEANEANEAKSTPSDRDGSVRVHSGSGFRFVVPFPWRLHQILDDMDAAGDTSIISWVPDGRHFHVHNPTLFVQEIIPKFFKQKSFKSFQRQLHIYGFQRAADFPNQGAYYHDKFVRGNRKLALEITRIKAPPRRRMTAKAAAAALEEKKLHAVAAGIAKEMSMPFARREIQLPAPRPLSSDTTEWLISAGVPFAALDPYPFHRGKDLSPDASILECASEIASIFNN